MIGGYHPWFGEELLRRTDAARSERAAALGQGTCSDYGAYRYECGVIEGMRLATEIADEIKREMDRQ